MFGHLSGQLFSPTQDMILCSFLVQSTKPSVHFRLTVNGEYRTKQHSNPPVFINTLLSPHPSLNFPLAAYSKLNTDQYM